LRSCASRFWEIGRNAEPSRRGSYESVVALDAESGSSDPAHSADIVVDGRDDTDRDLREFLSGRKFCYRIFTDNEATFTEMLPTLLSSRTSAHSNVRSIRKLEVHKSKSLIGRAFPAMLVDEKLETNSGAIKDIGG
jgi:hypothetical protein